MDNQKQYVVNIFGGPDAGKTTNMLLVTGKLKRAREKVKFAAEWIKDKVYDKSPYPFSDQVYVFAKQRKTILERLSEQRIRIVVTDSPLLMSAVYMGEADPLFEELVIREFYKTNNINIYLKRPDERDYDPVGRNQETREEAVVIDDKIKVYLDEYQVPYYEVISRDGSEDEILHIIMDKLSGRCALVPKHDTIYGGVV